jgi:Ser/Thr protein kinase RdoA (MazF antagonist)
MLADLADTVADAFGAGRVVEPLVLAAAGQQGRVWRLVTTAGALAVKELRIRQTEPEAAADVAYQQAVLAAGTVAMPRPVLTRSGHVLLEVDAHQLRAYTWVDLRPADRDLDPTLVGATLAAVHRVPFGPARPFSPWYGDPVGRARWTELLAAARTQHAPFAEDFAAEIPVLLQLEALFASPQRLRACHRDLWSDNLLTTPAGAACVVDWENCGLADPAQEIPMVLVDFGQGDPGRVATLFGAYVDAGGPWRLDGPGSFTMLTAQFGHFWELAVSRYVATGASEAVRAHSLGRVAELVAEPFRPAHLEELLDLVG